MAVTSCIIPVNHNSNAALERLISAGTLLQVADQPAGIHGEVYRPADHVIRSISAGSDHTFLIGGETLAAPVYRLPEWEYTHLIRQSAMFTQRPLYPLLAPLLRTRTPAEETSWCSGLLEQLARSPARHWPGTAACG